MSKQVANDLDNSLLWTGEKINAGAGMDTVQLRSGEELDGATLASKLKNVEVLDLLIGGANTISGLTAANVLAMTDSNHKLTINGDALDKVLLANDASSGWSNWVSTGIAGGYTIYTSAKGSETVTVLVDSDIQNGSQARMSSFSMPAWGELFSSDSGAINLDNVLPASSMTTTSLLGVTAAGASSSDSAAALYAPLPQSALDDELHQLSVVHY